MFSRCESEEKWVDFRIYDDLRKIGKTFRASREQNVLRRRKFVFLYLKS